MNPTPQVKIWPKRLIILSLVLFGLFVTVRIYFRATDDFRIANMTHDMGFHPEWEIPTLSSENKANIRKILNQEFHYVGKGAQSYVFASKDKKYVIKFFKFKHLKPSWFVANLPQISIFEEYKQSNIARKERLLNSVFNGYKLGYDQLRNETGLVYLHLNRSSDLKMKLTVKDKIGLPREIDLDSVVFVIQKKVKTTRQVIHDALTRGNVEEARNNIRNILDFYMKEYEKGIYDRDHGVLHNTGFAEKEVIHLDIGKLTKDDSMRDPVNHKSDLIKVAKKFEVWLKENHPYAYTPIVLDMKEYLSEKFGKTVNLSS